MQSEPKSGKATDSSAEESIPDEVEGEQVFDLRRLTAVGQRHDHHGVSDGARDQGHRLGVDQGSRLVLVR